MIFPNEASYIADWSPHVGVTYHQFLLAKQIEKSIRFGLVDSAKQIISSNEQLSKRGFNIIHEDLQSGFSVLSEDIAVTRSEARKDAARLAGTLVWGFSQLSRSLNRLDDSLKELIRLASTPSQTWAYEQFEIARLQFKRGYYPVALESIKRAINGFGGNTGYQSEFRFHLLLGKIRLGSWHGDRPNTSDAIVDPAAAEKAFYDAYKYYWGHNPSEEGAEILLWAARAAFVAENLNGALWYARTALGLTPHNAEAHYQIARFLCVQDPNSIEALEHLVEAFDLNLDLVVKSGGIGEFPSDCVPLQTALTRKADALRAIFLKRMDDFQIAFANAMRYTFDGKSSEVILRAELQSLADIKSTLAAQVASGGILDIDAAISSIQNTQPIFGSLFNAYKKNFADAIRADFQPSLESANQAVQEAQSACELANSTVEQLENDRTSAEGLIGVAALCILASAISFLISGVGGILLGISFVTVGIVMATLSIRAYVRTQKALANVLRLDALTNARRLELRQLEDRIRERANSVSNAERPLFWPQDGIKSLTQTGN
ncbi:MAG: hypothetical protein P4L57_02330 [Rhizomicrobium sp.]|nr:hypothetical protein [Rhizomicrobium sp.]